MSEQGPRQPLEERDAEIALLCLRIAIKDDAMQEVRKWLMQFDSTAFDSAEIDTVLEVALNA